MKKYIVELMKASAMVTGISFVFPMLLSLFALPRSNGYMLMVLVMAFALVMFSILMIPCVRFVAMIRKQERMGYPFEKGTTQLIDKRMTGTYLGDEWIIRAGYVALHCSQCVSVSSEPRSASRFGLHHGIVIETTDGHVYHWPLSQKNVKVIRAWLEQKTRLLHEGNETD